MKPDDQRNRKRQQLLNETRRLLLDVKQQYNVPLPTIRPAKSLHTVRDFMKENVPTAKLTTDLMDATELLVSKEITHLPVLKGDELVGIVSRDDVLRGIVEKRKKVEDVFTKKVVTLNEDDSIQLAMKKASDYNISVFPVVNAEGKLTGTLSIKDIEASRS